MFTPFSNNIPLVEPKFGIACYLLALSTCSFIGLSIFKLIEWQVTWVIFYGFFALVSYAFFRVIYNDYTFKLSIYDYENSVYISEEDLILASKAQEKSNESAGYKAHNL